MNEWRGNLPSAGGQQAPCGALLFPLHQNEGQVQPGVPRMGALIGSSGFSSSMSPLAALCAWAAISQTDVSRYVRGDRDRYSVLRLMLILPALGNDVPITVPPAPWPSFGRALAGALWRTAHAWSRHTGNLDSANGEEVMEILSQLNGEGPNMVMVTHSHNHLEHAHCIVSLLDGAVATENVH